MIWNLGQKRPKKEVQAIVKKGHYLNAIKKPADTTIYMIKSNESHGHIQIVLTEKDGKK